jgi:hypothetical protein
MSICLMIFTLSRYINSILSSRKSSLLTSSTKINSLSHCWTIFKTLLMSFKENIFKLSLQQLKMNHVINLELNIISLNQSVFQQSEVKIKTLKKYLEEFQKCEFIWKNISSYVFYSLCVQIRHQKSSAVCQLLRTQHHYH